MFRKEPRFWPQSSDRVIALLAIVALSGFAGCESDGGTPTKNIGTGQSASKTSPATPNVSRIQAWKDAEMIASMAPGRTEVIGSGESMKPVYGDNTILVITKINFDELKPGMSVAYRNSRAREVVHNLLKKEAQGWRIQGLNNDSEDTDRVTRENLIGVVYASITYDDKS